MTADLPDPAPTRSLCARHPEAPVSFECSRCGDFLCSECRAPESPKPLCTSCLDRLAPPHVKTRLQVLAILLMIHGGLVALMGIFLTVYAGSMLYVFGTLPETPDSPLSNDALGGFMAAIGGAMALVHVLVGGVQLFGGYRLQTHRARGVATFALAAGTLTIVGCYCAPTAILLMGVGLYLLYNREASDLFDALSPP